MSTNESSANLPSLEHERDETVKLVLDRLIFIVCASVLCWCAIGGILFSTSFPSLAPAVEGKPLEGPVLLSVRLGAAILIAHFVSVVLVQLFAPIVHQEFFIRSQVQVPLQVATTQGVKAERGDSPNSIFQRSAMKNPAA